MFGNSCERQHSIHCKWWSNSSASSLCTFLHCRIWTQVKHVYLRSCNVVGSQRKKYAQTIYCLSPANFLDCPEVKPKPFLKMWCSMSKIIFFSETLKNLPTTCGKVKNVDLCQNMEQYIFSHPCFFQTLQVSGVILPPTLSSMAHFVWFSSSSSFCSHQHSFSWIWLTSTI